MNLENVLCVVAGMVVMAVINYCSKPEEPNKEIYKCKDASNMMCSDICCKFCIGATECNYACRKSPDSCGQVIRVK